MEVPWPVSGSGPMKYSPAATPDRASVAGTVSVAVTGAVGLPVGLGLVVHAGVPSMGGVLSMLIPLTVTVAVLSARSDVEPDAVWLVPSPVRVTGLGQVAMPDGASVQV